jgi:hypothetical protein
VKLPGASRRSESVRVRGQFYRLKRFKYLVCNIYDATQILVALIPDCGDTDSSAAPSALKHGAYIPLDHRTFLQWMSRWGRMQHESGSASFGQGLIRHFQERNALWAVRA